MRASTDEDMQPTRELSHNEQRRLMLPAGQFGQMVPPMHAAAFDQMRPSVNAATFGHLHPPLWTDSMLHPSQLPPLPPPLWAGTMMTNSSTAAFRSLPPPPLMQIRARLAD